MSELVSLENERREKLFIEEEARAELFQRVCIIEIFVSNGFVFKILKHH